MSLQNIALDASTLILLAKIDLLQIVAEKTDVHIPNSVRDEALAKPEAYDAQLIARMVKENTIHISERGSPAEVKAIRKQFRLAEGEAAALQMAKERHYVLGIDDGPGLRAAKILGVPFVTALNILVGLSEEGLLDKPSAMAKLDSLVAWGRYSGQLISDARARLEKGGV